MNVMKTGPRQMMRRLAAPATAKAWSARVTHTDMAMPLNQIYLYKPTGTGIGYGDNLKKCFGLFTDSRMLLKAVGEM